MTGSVSSIADRARRGEGAEPPEDPAAAAANVDHTFDDSNLETLLDKRESKKDARRKANKEFKAEDDKVKARLEEFNLADGEVARVGKYRIEKKAITGKSVSFDTDPSSRVNISLFPGN